MLVVIDGLDLSDIARNGYREPSRRVDLSGEDFCNCLTTKHSRLPGFDYGIDVLLCPYQTQSPAVEQHEHGRPAAGYHRLEQFLLHSRKLQVVAVVVLAAGTAVWRISLRILP